MPSVAELAAHFGVSRARAYQLVNQGCPRTSFKAADKWRNARGLKRAPTNLAKWQKTDDPKDDPIPRVKDGSRSDRKFAVDPREAEIRKRMRKPSDTGNSLQDALNNSIAVAKGAFLDYEYARTGNLATRPMRLSEHNKAVEAQLKAEAMYRAELERRSVLVDKTAVLERCRKSLDAVLRRLKKLPTETGPQCNEIDPLKSTQILQRAVDDIISTGMKELRALSEP